MSKTAAFTVKLEPELRRDFKEEAGLQHQTASQMVRKLMRDFTEQSRKAREYDEYLEQKLAISRAQMMAGQGLSNDEVKAEFAAKREQVLSTQI